MMSRWLPARLVLAIGLCSLIGACSGGMSAQPAVDDRGDALCANAQATETGGSCDLSIAMHGHTYLLRCDLAAGTCFCSRDGRRLPGEYGFGGSITPSCTVTYLDFEWADCCGTPE